MQKHNTNRWQELIVPLTAARFANRQEGGNDLTLYNMGTEKSTVQLLFTSCVKKNGSR